MKKHLAGFTVLELLGVMAIIGVLSIVFFDNVTTSLRKSELNEAANQIAADFKKARSVAQKQSTNAVIAWPGNNFSTYTITQGTNTTPFKVLNGVTVTCSGACSSNSLTYSAPYGEIKGITTGPIFTLTSPLARLNTPATEIRIVGVTGKVIIGKTGL